MAVLVPVLNRPARVAQLVASIRESERAAKLAVMFLCSPSDTAEIDAVVAAGEHPHIVTWPPDSGDYARKINWGYRRAISMGHEWMLTGADDLLFHQGWADEALLVAKRTRCCVIGTNDLGNPQVKRGQHATHSLVHADYLVCGTVDEDDQILHQGYDHCFVDNELVETARARRTFAMAGLSIVEHKHPIWGKGEQDETYAKGQRDFDADRLLFRSRQHLWNRL